MPTKKSQPGPLPNRKEDSLELESIPDFDFNLEIPEQSYKKEPGDPLHAWEAVQYCLTENLDMPVWVKEYLREVAENLLAIKKVGKRGGEILRDALKISDFGVFADHIQAREKQLIFQMVHLKMQQIDRPDVLTIFADVADDFKPISRKEQYSQETIKEIYYDLKTVYDKQSAEEEKQTIVWEKDSDCNMPPRK